jgi:hypothetical protein
MRQQHIYINTSFENGRKQKYEEPPTSSQLSLNYLKMKDVLLQLAGSSQILLSSALVFFSFQFSCMLSLLPLPFFPPPFKKSDFPTLKHSLHYLHLSPKVDTLILTLKCHLPILQLLGNA